MRSQFGPRRWRVDGKPAGAASASSIGGVQDTSRDSQAVVLPVILSVSAIALAPVSLVVWRRMIFFFWQNRRLTPSAAGESAQKEAGGATPGSSA